MKSVILRMITVLMIVVSFSADGMYSSFAGRVGRGVRSSGASTTARNAMARQYLLQRPQPGRRGYSAGIDQDAKENINYLNKESIGASMNPPAKPGLISSWFASKEVTNIENAYQALINETVNAVQLWNRSWLGKPTFLNKESVLAYIQAASGSKHNIINRLITDSSLLPKNRTLLHTIISFVAASWNYALPGDTDNEPSSDRSNVYRSDVVRDLYNNAGARLTESEKQSLLSEHEVLQKTIREFQYQYQPKAFRDLKSFAGLCLLLNDIGVNVESAGIDIDKAQQLSLADLGELADYSPDKIKRAADRFVGPARMGAYHMSKNDVPDNLGKQASELAKLIFIPEAELKHQFANE